MEKRERVQGPDHPDLASTANRLAGLCSRDGRYAEAEALYRRALAIREKTFGPDHIHVAEPLEGLAKVCEQTGRADEAQEFSARAQAIRERAQAASEKTVDSRQ
jgi:tetratricopeptide (TPR) repeat protein